MYSKNQPVPSRESPNLSNADRIIRYENTKRKTFVVFTAGHLPAGDLLCAPTLRTPAQPHGQLLTSPETFSVWYNPRECL